MYEEKVQEMEVQEMELIKQLEIAQEQQRTAYIELETALIKSRKAIAQGVRKRRQLEGGPFGSADVRKHLAPKRAASRRTQPRARRSKKTTASRTMPEWVYSIHPVMDPNLSREEQMAHIMSLGYDAEAVEEVLRDPQSGVRGGDLERALQRMQWDSLVHELEVNHAWDYRVAGLAARDCLAAEMGDLDQALARAQALVGADQQGAQQVRDALKESKDDPADAWELIVGRAVAAAQEAYAPNEDDYANEEYDNDYEAVYENYEAPVTSAQ